MTDLDSYSITTTIMITPEQAAYLEGWVAGQRWLLAEKEQEMIEHLQEAIDDDY